MCKCKIVITNKIINIDLFIASTIIIIFIFFYLLHLLRLHHVANASDVTLIELLKQQTAVFAPHKIRAG